jgi:hypothetical protein
MKRLLLAAAIIASPALAADTPKLDLEQKTLLRCSAAFAIIAYEQGKGVDSALAYPPLAERGKEYFVRAGAQLIDAHQLTHEQVDALYRAEIKHLQDESATSDKPEEFVSALMQSCLLSLEASGI